MNKRIKKKPINVTKAAKKVVKKAEPKNKHNRGTDPGEIKNDWRTPVPLLEAIYEHFEVRVILDAAADKENRITKFHLGIERDTPNMEAEKIQKIFSEASKYYKKLTPDSPFVHSIFMNPPYNDPKSPLEKFIDKAIEVSNLFDTSWLVLIPGNKTEQPFFHKIIAARDVHICYIRKRVNFLDSDGKPGTSPNHPSIVVAFGDVAREMNHQHDKNFSSLYWDL